MLSSHTRQDNPVWTNPHSVQVNVFVVLVVKDVVLTGSDGLEDP